MIIIIAQVCLCQVTIKYLSKYILPLSLPLMSPPLTYFMLLLRAIAGHLGVLNEIGLW